MSSVGKQKEKFVSSAEDKENSLLVYSNGYQSAINIKPQIPTKFKDESME
jgi:hypothetical protein